MLTLCTLNKSCIISKVHPASARKCLFARVMSEHQHLVSLVNFKTVWQHAATVKQFWPDLESMAWISLMSMIADL